MKNVFFENSIRGRLSGFVSAMHVVCKDNQRLV